MRFLFDLQHPAHLHFFRNLIMRLKQEGHAVRVTGRDKDILAELAESFGIDVEIFGRARGGIVNMGGELLLRMLRLLRIMRAYKPDAVMAIAGTYASIPGRITHTPVYVFYDTEHATLSNLLAYPFATCVYVPSCYGRKIRSRHVRYNGYHELAYLHPAYFTPDPSVLEEAGLKPGERFSIVRFVGWGAAHDIGATGMTKAGKLRAVREIGRFGRVLISCEGDLPGELESHRLNLDVARIHHLLAHASLIFGESATMVSEGAVLGVPGVYVNPLRLGYLEEQELKYGLVFNYSPEHEEKALKKAVGILGMKEGEWKKNAARLVNEKIDVTGMLHQIALESP